MMRSERRKSFYAILLREVIRDGYRQELALVFIENNACFDVWPRHIIFHIF